MDLLENRLAERAEQRSSFTMVVSKLGKYGGCLVNVGGISLRNPSWSCSYMTYTSTMSAALFMFSQNENFFFQNEKFNKEFEVNHVPRGTLVNGVLSIG